MKNYFLFIISNNLKHKHGIASEEHESVTGEKVLRVQHNDVTYRVTAEYGGGFSITNQHFGYKNLELEDVIEILDEIIGEHQTI